MTAKGGGPRVALFRERKDANASAARLRKLGFSVACLPAIEIRTSPVRPQRSRYDAVIATSDKAFHADGPPRHVFAALCRRRAHGPGGRGARLAAGLAAGAGRRRIGQDAGRAAEASGASCSTLPGAIAKT